jgi:hypothetical protein
MLAQDVDQDRTFGRHMFGPGGFSSGIQQQAEEELRAGFGSPGQASNLQFAAPN